MAERELLLLRHGIAEPRNGVDERLRPLTPEGRLRTRRVCGRAVQLGLVAQALVSSPLARARQTAEIAVAEGLAPALSCSEALAPEADPWPLLQAWWAGAMEPTADRLILVGHEPDLGLLACRLIGARAGAVPLKKAGIALLAWPLEQPTASLAACPAQLRLLLTPRLLTS